MKRWKVVAVVTLALAALGGTAAGFLIFRPRLPAAERGRRLAERTGCFGCHGAEGTQGAANPGRTDGTVPEFGGELMMFAQGREEVREWIRDGVTAARAKSKTWQTQRDKGALRMPAFGKRLSESEIEDLTEFVVAASGAYSAPDSLAARGLERAESLGCLGCHGAGGRMARPNPGSLKGYVPSWDGADFPELVSGRAEFQEWVERGVSRRFESNPIARFFLDRAVLRMPPYRTHLDVGDVDALWAYVQWLRSPRSR